MRLLNVVGAGRVGRTLARLWHAKEVFGIGDVLARSSGGAGDAVRFIGAGRAAGRLTDMAAAGVWMLSVPDAAIRGCADALGASGLLRPGDVVFHCSGALSSAELAGATGATAASVHPLKTFADPPAAVRGFEVTHCAAEGAPEALAVLKPAFEAIGARVVEIAPERKTIYHAASVIVCNYLTALMEAGLACFERAGFARDTAATMMEPLVREALDNVFALGTVRALTGPIARGDDAVVARELEALVPEDARLAALYRDLGAIAVELAARQGQADPAALDRLRELLGRG